MCTYFYNVVQIFIHIIRYIYYVESPPSLKISLKEASFSRM